MSAIYNLEPQPTASAILHTTQGDLSVELWAKQAPLTCRNFLQLALDGYYDNTIFHRLIPGFILQGGDPTGTGNGGESIYDGGAFSDELDPWPMDERRGQNAGPTGVCFKDEFHSRLKFNRRGLLGMANESKPDTNGSQFFFTLDQTEELTNKNTLFGRIMGDTIYNLAKMGEGEVTPGTDRPTYPVKITSVEILVNPFEDMVKRSRVAAQAPKTVVVERKKKRKGGKQLLSFGDEEGEGEVTPAFKKPKFDTRIVMDLEEEEHKKTEKKGKKTAKSQPHQAAANRKPAPTTELHTSDEEDTPQAKKASPPPKRLPVKMEIESSPEPEERPQKTALEKANEEIAALKASMKRNFQTEQAPQAKKKSALENMIPETSVRGRKRRTGGTTVTREDQAALDLLNAFKSKLDQVPAGKEMTQRPKPDEAIDDKVAKSGDDEDTELCDLHFIVNCQSCKAWDKAGQDEESDDEGWMSQALSFKADKLGKDLSYRKKAEEELVVIDPRAKARTLQEEKKAEREARSGKTGREWDQARNAKMAKASALAGRGAR
ncbi:peptidyl-prolyl isomerase CWC27 [Verticillium alfalfae VaMs.102]|uniref:peptidylprolyl isomerase n=1 Tax=Verticillium alfalfae (strain VaMs.102 / ATCC MYA-4576 / FGSC 10136) TaxID=526221 RepID=C9SKP9_VERA1|nr:peptidyl-prolyl isomerase CWC27 [Verticillium alfalfae VaMs.102]EEY19267.1 peptidyl-prolyl isomerase CWC27 [Verticillium alfalfae VaMs.102]